MRLVTSNDVTAPAIARSISLAPACETTLSSAPSNGARTVYLSSVSTHWPATRIGRFVGDIARTLTRLEIATDGYGSTPHDAVPGRGTTRYGRPPGRLAATRPDGVAPCASVLVGDRRTRSCGSWRW